MEMDAKAQGGGEVGVEENLWKPMPVLLHLPGFDTCRDKITCLPIIQMQNSGKYMLSSSLPCHWSILVNGCQWEVDFLDKKDLRYIIILQVFFIKYILFFGRLFVYL